jgi:hypothetical protein
MPYAIACRPFRAYEWLFLCVRVGQAEVKQTLKCGFYLEMLLFVMNDVIL